MLEEVKKKRSKILVVFYLAELIVKSEKNGDDRGLCFPTGRLETSKFHEGMIFFTFQLSSLTFSGVCIRMMIGSLRKMQNFGPPHYIW